MKFRPRKTPLKEIDGNRVGHTKNIHDKALELKAKHDAYMKGKKTILVKHPTALRCWIEKIVPTKTLQKNEKD